MFIHATCDLQKPTKKSKISDKSDNQTSQVPLLKSTSSSSSSLPPTSTKCAVKSPAEGTNRITTIRRESDKLNDKRKFVRPKNRNGDIPRNQYIFDDGTFSVK